MNYYFTECIRMSRGTDIGDEMFSKNYKFQNCARSAWCSFLELPKYSYQDPSLSLFFFFFFFFFFFLFFFLFCIFVC